MVITSRTFISNLDLINDYIKEIDDIAEIEDVYTEHHLAVTKDCLVILTTYNNGKSFKDGRNNTETL